MIDRFQFPESNVTILCNEEATKAAIMEAFLRLESSSPDDRVVFFFAGHGDTRRGNRGEVGFLVPHEGETLNTLLRWDELTRNAELVPAKHMLFIMDACYGGLALARTLRAGSMRFVNDMLTRPARQVLTAGKADQSVADGGGPRVGHSMFTGHLLDALDGKAAGPDRILTAGNVTSYVYERVAKDQRSSQSPHYGHLDGDGDLIFNPPAPTIGDGRVPEDVLVQVPAILESVPGAGDNPFLVRAKEYLSEPRHRIALDELVNTELKAFLHTTREEVFSANSPLPSRDTIRERLREYELASDRLFQLMVLLTRWGDATCHPLINRVMARMADNSEMRGGTTLWLNLRWYPILRIIYAVTITSVVTGQYENLRAAFTAAAGDHVGQDAKTVLVVALDCMHDTSDAFKLLPGQDRHYVPISEYLFAHLQAPMEDLLFLGRSYEKAFDHAEMFLSVALADADPSGRGWYPVGRFSWKHRRRFNNSPVSVFEAEVKASQSSWAPLRVGFFGGDAARAQRHAENLLARSNSFQAY